MTTTEEIQPQDIQQNKVVYDILSGVDNPDGWDLDHKQKNFTELAEIAGLTDSGIKDKSCLDVGCGTGDFSDFWKQNAGRHYVGIDIYEPSIDKAKQKHPDAEFKIDDILSPSSGLKKSQFDYVFASGPLSVSQKSRDNYVFLEKMVKRMLEISKTGVAFNFLVNVGEDLRDLLFQYDPERVLQICRTISSENEVIGKPSHHNAQWAVYMVKNNLYYLVF